MPTIKEIADACGVTKPTVTKKLKELGMWASHVSKSGNTFTVTDEAASAVAASLVPSAVSDRGEQPKHDNSSVYEAYIADLKLQNERLWEQVREKDALIAELTQKLAENSKPSFWSRLLPGAGKR